MKLYTGLKYDMAAESALIVTQSTMVNHMLWTIYFS